jgi:predicted signal transduction protein with EAL and GGDEF domain
LPYIKTYRSRSYSASYQIIESISKPYQDTQQNPILLSASAGISRCPDNVNDIEHLIMRADAAMYEAKKLGKKRWVEYQSGMEKGLKRLSDLAQKLSLAEKTGLIHDIENWGLNRAMSDLLTFKQIRGQHITMAVNISGLHMSEPNPGKHVFSLSKLYSIQPSDLTIELTQSVLMTNIDAANFPTNQMTKQVIKLSIDVWDRLFVSGLFTCHTSQCCKSG